MEKREIERYRRQLRALTTRMQSDAMAVTEQIREGSGGQSGGALSNAPMHLGDMGTDEYLQDMNATLLENEEFLSNEIREAFDRIENGTFGRCENCGKPIPKERLDAIPYARWCAPCAEAADKGSAVNFNAGRPQRPRDTLAPQGEMDESGRRRTRRTRRRDRSAIASSAGGHPRRRHSGRRDRGRGSGRQQCGAWRSRRGRPARRNGKQRVGRAGSSRRQ